jgi:hypothetical protein
VVNILPHTPADDPTPSAPAPSALFPTPHALAPSAAAGAAFLPAPIPLPSFSLPLQSPLPPLPDPVAAAAAAAIPDQHSSSVAAAAEQPLKRRRPKNSTTTTTEQCLGDLSGVANSFLVDTIVALKEDVHAMTDKVRRMKKRNARQVQQFQADMREMQRRLQLLEDDNAQLRRRLVPHASDINATTSLCTASSSSSSSQPVSSPIASHKREATMSGDDGDAGDQAPPISSRPLLQKGTGLSSEMYWCFPFLQRFDLSPSRFVVDDLQYLPTLRSLVGARACAHQCPEFLDASGKRSRSYWSGQARRAASSSPPTSSARCRASPWYHHLPVCPYARM